MNEQEIKDLQYETIDRLQKRIKELESYLKEIGDLERSTNDTQWVEKRDIVYYFAVRNLAEENTYE